MNAIAHFPDLSHYEPDVDFHEVQAGGAPLVITKATQAAFTDPTWADFAARIRSVGLVLGGFVYEEAAPEAAQIAHYFSAAHLQVGDLQPVLDAEAAGLTLAETVAALEDMANRGYRPILYCSLAFWNDVLGGINDYWIWLAAYRDALPDLPADTKLFAWQHTDCATFPGVAKPCDASYLYAPLCGFLI